MSRFNSLLAVVLLFASAAFAEIVDITPTGFVVKHSTTIGATPEQVYEALTRHVGDWWSPDHTYSHDAHNLSIDARPGGCFCEKLPGGGGVEHMTVVFLSPGHILRMTGATGPLQEWGLAGSMTWTLAPSNGSTKLEFSYSVGGYKQGGFEKIAPTIDAVFGEQLNRLKAFVETGKPERK